MKAFAALYRRLDETTKTNAKIAALAEYFGQVPSEDGAWAVHFLSGNRPKRLLSSRKLREWAGEAAGLPPWLVEECYDAVGDGAETASLLLPPSPGTGDLPLHRWVEERLLPLKGEDEAVQKGEVLRAWAELGGTELYLWNKLITGAFRVGVSRRLVVRGLAAASGVDEAAIAHRLMGNWEPRAESYLHLFAEDTGDADISRPYPFFLAHAIEGGPESLGQATDWQAEWKWDGIRAQLVRRGGRVFLWSRGEELITERFPEISEAASLLADGTVIDGELMPWREGDVPLPFAQLQRRIGRKKLGPKILRDVPVVLLAYDLLEHGGHDVRGLPMTERRQRLEAALAEVRGSDRLRLSPIIEAADWERLHAAHAEARARGAEGLMLKRRGSPYRVGRKRGDWWKWKVEPFTCDAVLLYAQRGTGRRASLHTDYTFALWQDGELVPFAKAYSGLTDAEIGKVDRWVRRNTVEKFGPVRSVKPELVFELAFEGIQRSTRHKSGIAVRFPRILRWRTDKPAAEADSLDSVSALLG